MTGPCTLSEHRENSCAVSETTQGLVCKCEVSLLGAVIAMFASGEQRCSAMIMDNTVILRRRERQRRNQ